jgi:hypothetical protein
MSKYWSLLLATGLMAVMAGCVAPPQVFHPGSAKQQQATASRFDPYPENDLGPAVVGARPRDFAYPQAEVLRVQPRRDEVPLAPGPPSLPSQPVLQ